MKVWTCSNCGYVHMTEQVPISCIVCNNDVFLDQPNDYYKEEENHVQDID